MGGGNKSQTVQHQEQKTERNPWAPSVPGLEEIIASTRGLPQGLSGVETGALDALTQRAQAGNIWAPQIQNVATNLLSGGPDYTGRVFNAMDQYRGQYGDYRNQLMPTISGEMLDPNKNPFFAKTTQGLGDDAFNRINALYAGSGRDSSGAGSFAQNAAEGVSQATAPIYAQIYGNERDRQLAAMGSLWNAGGQLNTAEGAATGLLSNLSQTSLANQQAGIGAATAAQQAIDAPQQALLNIEAMRRSIPQQELAFKAGLLTPIAQLGGTGSSTTDSTSTQTMKEDPTKAIIGAAIAAGGLAMGNPMAALGMASSMGSAGFGGTAPASASGYGYNAAMNAPNYGNPYGGSWYG
jgi:hypothetical protein